MIIEIDNSRNTRVFFSIITYSILIYKIYDILWLNSLLGRLNIKV